MLETKLYGPGLAGYPHDVSQPIENPRRWTKWKAPRSGVDPTSPATRSFSQVHGDDQPDTPTAASGRQRLLTVRSPRIHRRMSSCAVAAISAAISEAFS
jgi:hypothetical protein